MACFSSHDVNTCGQRDGRDRIALGYRRVGARVRRVGARLKVRMVVFHGAFSQNMQKLPVWKTGFAHFGATSASDRFDRGSVARGIDFDAVGKARLIENRAKIDPHSLRERESAILMKWRKVKKCAYVL